MSVHLSILRDENVAPYGLGRERPKQSSMRSGAISSAREPHPITSVGTLWTERDVIPEMNRDETT